VARKEQRSERQSKSRQALRAGAAKSEPAAVAVPVPAAPRGKAKDRAGTVIAGCICACAFQDARYGAGRRVFNIGRKGGVCGEMKSI